MLTPMTENACTKPTEYTIKRSQLFSCPLRRTIVIGLRQIGHSLSRSSSALRVDVLTVHKVCTGHDYKRLLCRRCRMWSV